MCVDAFFYKPVRLKRSQSVYVPENHMNRYFKSHLELDLGNDLSLYDNHKGD